MFYRRSRCVETPALFLWVRPAALCGADLQTFSFFCDLSVKSNGFERSWTFYVKGGESVFSALMDSSEGFGPANVENFTDIL